MPEGVEFNCYARVDLHGLFAGFSGFADDLPKVKPVLGTSVWVTSLDSTYQRRIRTW